MQKPHSRRFLSDQPRSVVHAVRQPPLCPMESDPDELSASVSTLFQNALARRREVPAGTIPASVRRVITRTWELLRAEGARLSDAVPAMLLSRLPRATAMLERCAQATVANISQILLATPECETNHGPRDHAECHVLRVACGNAGKAGKTGFLNIAGNSVRWALILSHKYGVIAAFAHLDIHIMGVPAARLSPGLVHPELQGYTIC